MSKVQRRLKVWLDEGLMPASQYEKIMSFEASHSATSFSSVLSLGIFAIAVGCLSLIAANWEAIPDSIKLLVDQGVLLLLAFSLYRLAPTNRTMYFNGLLLLFALLCLASIGLIAQIYQLSSSPWYSPLLLWSMMIFPLALLASNPLLPLVWSLVFFIALPCALFEWLHIRFEINQWQLGIVFFSLPYVAGLSGVALARFKRGGRLLSACKQVALLWFLALITVLDLCLSAGFDAKQHAINTYPWVIILLGAGVILAYTDKRREQILLAGLTGCYALYVYLFSLSLKLPIISALLTMLCLSLLAMLAAFKQRTFFFNGLILLLALRLWLIYIENCSGLAMTGFGLILSGVFVLFCAWLWRRYHLVLFSYIAARGEQ